MLDRAQKNELGIGKLDTHDNLIDMTTGTVKLRAVFDNKDEALFPNQFVNVRLLVDTVKDATVVPVAAIQRGQPGTFVYLVKADDTVEIRVVELGVDRRREGADRQGPAGRRPGRDRRHRPPARRRQDPPAGRRPPRAASGPPVAAAPPDAPAAGGAGQRQQQRRRQANGGARRRRRGRPAQPTSNPGRDMNPSRIFIERPVGDLAADGRDHAGRA